jgi:AcrR family transcriptional regulator
MPCIEAGAPVARSGPHFGLPAGRGTPISGQQRSIDEWRDMARAKSARPEDRTETSKRQIIDAAIDVIAQRGLGKSTLQNIAERAGVSSALVVFHFKSKDNLMKAVLGHLTAVYDAGWERSLRPAGDPAAKRLMRLVTYDLKFPAGHPKYLAAWYAFWGEARGGLLYKRIGRAGDDQCLVDIRQAIEEIVPEGGYEGIDCRCVAETIYVMIFGHWHVAQNEAERYDIALARKTFTDYLSSIFPGEDWAGC